MIRILALAVNPSNTRRLRIDKEFRDIQLELSKFKSHYFEFISYGAIQTVDFANLLQQYQPNILHFSGHGAEQSLYFEDASGRAVEFDIASLEQVFQIHNNLSLIYLNSCLSENLASALAPYAKCIVGSTTKVEDNDAIIFSKSFYSFIAQGQCVKKAFDLAKVQVRATKGDTNFILTSKPGTDPSTTFLPFSPKLLAKFISNRKGVPSKIFTEYKMQIFVHAVPPDVTEANYYYNDPSISKRARFEIRKDTRNKFLTDVSFYGDIDLRVTLWKSSGREGVSIGGNLSDALESYYRMYPDELTEAVLTAIAKIKSK